MDLNDEVRVTLTEKGAEIINAANKEMADKCQFTSIYFKHDYKEGDHYQKELHDIMYHFGGSYCCPGSLLPFTDLILITSRS